MKAIWITILVSLLALGTSCASQERKFGIEPTQVDLKTLQEKEIAASNLKSTTREAFENLQEEYKTASEQDKPEILLRLVEAKAAYRNAQREHMHAKRDLEEMKRVYMQRLLQGEGIAGTG